MCACEHFARLQKYSVVMWCKHAFADVTFSDNGAAIISYIICCIYFEVGGLQLHFGFPDAPPRHSLTSNGFKFPYSILFPYVLRAPSCFAIFPLSVSFVCVRTACFKRFPSWTRCASFWTGYAPARRSICSCGSSWNGSGAESVTSTIFACDTGGTAISSLPLLYACRGDLFRIQCYNTANAADQETLSGRRPQVRALPLQRRGRRECHRRSGFRTTAIYLEISERNPHIHWPARGLARPGAAVQLAEPNNDPEPRFRGRSYPWYVTHAAFALIIMAFTLALLPAVSDNTGVYVLFDTVHFRSLSTVSDSGEFSTLQQVSRVGSRASDLKYDMMPLTQVYPGHVLVEAVVVHVDGLRFVLQRLELLPYPTVNWDISPPAAEDLLEKLANCSHGLLVLNVELNVAFHRPGPTGCVE